MHSWENSLEITSHVGLPFLEMMEVDILGKESEGSSHRMPEHFMVVPGCSGLSVKGLLPPVLVRFNCQLDTTWKSPGKRLKVRLACGYICRECVEP